MTSDEAMIEASRRDPRAFEPLLARHGAAIHAYLARRTAAGAADDLLAEVWLAAFAGRTTFDPALGNVRGWLFGIARNVLSGHDRRGRGRSAAEAAAGEPDVHDARDTVDDLHPMPGWDELEGAGSVPAVEPAVLARAQSAVRAAATAEAEGTPVSVLTQHQPRRGRRKLPPSVVAGAAALAALAIALPNLSWGGSHGGDPAALPPSGTVGQFTSTPEPPKTGPLLGSAAADCVEDYTLENLAGRDFAFDGTVVAVRSAIDARNDDGDVVYPDATFKVNEWFRGGTGPTVTISMQTPGDVGDVRDREGSGYGVGSRLLISGEPLHGGKPLDRPIAWSCGFSRYYDAATAQTWRTAFGG